MDIDEWGRMAAAEADKTLHKFNYDRERAFDSKELQKAHDAFAEFLRPIAVTPGVTASSILRSYLDSIARSVADKAVDATPGPDDFRFTPPALRRGSAQVFLRSTGAYSELLHHLGILEDSYWTAHDDIRTMLTDEDFDGDVDPAMESELQRLADTVSPILPIDSHHATVPFIDPDRLKRTKIDPARGNGPWWFTYEDHLQAEHDRLPDPSDPLQKSGYVAGLRATLGLKHDSENLKDRDAALPAGAAPHSLTGTSFRIYIQFSMHIREADKDALCQPNLFSDGYPHLFLSAPRREDGGRTVRLKDTLCGCLPDCQCAGEGLPEGVVPEQIVLACPDRRVRGVYLGLHKDLSRYAIPTCDEIRKRWAAAA